ncbi:MAG TPA: urate oxidase [Vicinamibacterales bacterium]|nr:urate oxidase [Vicinamibacterales bacterium]
MLEWNRYGKSRVRLVKVRRPAAGHEPHEVVDLTIDVQLEGAFDAVYVEGDNTACHATDTMKNTVYAFARRDPIAHVEAFALRLADHFIAKPAVRCVRVSAAEHRWDRLTVGGRPHPHAFVQPGGEQWTAMVTRVPEGSDVVAGIANLIVLKTTDSAFAGFPRDEYTTLPETGDRILATSVTASWRYRDPSVDFSQRARIRTALVEMFAAHDSQSVQHTLYAMGEAALAACREIDEITLSLPNRHHLLVDLTPFGLDNPNEVFVATDQPFGLIEATIRRP